MKYVYDFDHDHGVAPMELKGLLGGKGANLAEMTSVLHLPVPPGFTISTNACQLWLSRARSSDLIDEIDDARRRLEATTGKNLGASERPLLVSVRSGAKFSMPGMMDTVLNLGLNDHSVRGLAKDTGDLRFALDSYRRFISMYSKIVLGVEANDFDAALQQVKVRCGATNDSQVDVDALQSLIDIYKSIAKGATGEEFPQDPSEQFLKAIDAVFTSWTGSRAVAYRQREGIPAELGTAVNVQAMVFGNMDNRSGTGVGFTRDPATGERRPYGDFLVNAQGEDVVAGIRNPQPLETMEKDFPVAHAELTEIFRRLEHHYQDMCDTEFTIERDRLWMLQTRVGKRTGRAAIRMAVEMADESDLGIGRDVALLRVSEQHLIQVMHPQFMSPRPASIATGLAASPGAAVGKCYFHPDEVVKAVERGEKALLVRLETSPEDVHGILAAEGVLTSRGGLASHAAVVARGWGKPAVVGVDQLAIFDHHAELGGIRIGEGDWLSLDGTTGEIIPGVVPLAPSEASVELKTLLDWADDVRRGHLKVRANADTNSDAKVARDMGAEGIGLCRTEHMFLNEDRLPIVRRMILADNPLAESAALDELAAVQRTDFYSLLEAMDGLPVTVRLLDPPLHEFLPSIEELAVEEARGNLDEYGRDLLVAARTWRETNPMLGTRGVRLGFVRPGLYQAQVRALMYAVGDRLIHGGDPQVEIMIPLTVCGPELECARGWVEEVVAGFTSMSGFDFPSPKIGTMIETPRAALVADELARNSDFFSFGTNDLTQMTFGFSRDDVEGRLMELYLAKGFLNHNPFQEIDLRGVGELVRKGVELGRKANPFLSLGVCGEHGGDPMSIGLFVELGMDYVSCSPFRVPMARLAAAQAVLGRRAKSTNIGVP